MVEGLGFEAWIAILSLTRGVVNIFLLYAYKQLRFILESVPGQTQL